MAKAKRKTRAKRARKPRPRAIEIALAGLAHDIRTPLTGILALSQLLQASELPKRERGWAEAIRGAADHLARLTTIVVDDALQGVTDVVRGQDLFWSTSVHRVLQDLLGLPAPNYHHHRLVLDAGGKKLSKSTAATGLRELRERGMSASDVRRLVNVAM